MQKSKKINEFFYIPETTWTFISWFDERMEFLFFLNDFELTKTSYYAARPPIFIFTLIPIYRL